MMTYLVSLLSVVLLCSTIDYLSDHLRLYKQIMFICALTVLLVLFVPFAKELPLLLDSFSQTIAPSPPLSNADQSWLVATGVENVETQIEKDLIRELGFSEKDLSVKIHVNTDDITNINIEKIDVYLIRETDWYLENDIQTYLTELFRCKVTVICGR